MTVNEYMYCLNIVFQEFEAAIYLVAVLMITYSIAIFFKRIVVGYR